MSRWTSLALSLAMVAASTPAAAADPMGAVVDKVQRAQELRQFAAAAELAAPASRRTDLSAANRYLLAGLASESYGDAFTHGGAPRQPSGEPRFLCDQRTILQEAAVLARDPEEAALVRNALQGVAGQLAAVAASGRAVPCAVAPPADVTPGDEVLLAVPTRPTAASKFAGRGRSPATLTAATEGPAPVPTTALPRRRPTARVAVGSSLLVAGVGLAGGVAVSLVARDRMNGAIAALDATATAQGRDLTPEEKAAAKAADARFVRFGNASVAFGTLAGLSLLTAVVLLAVPPKARATSRARVRPAGAGIHLTF